MYDVRDSARWENKAITSPAESNRTLSSIKERTNTATPA